MSKETEQIMTGMKQAGEDLRSLAETLSLLAQLLDKTAADIQKLNGADIAAAVKKPISQEQRELIDLLKGYEEDNAPKVYANGKLEFSMRVILMGERLEVSSHKAGRLVHSIGLQTKRFHYGYAAFWMKGDLERIEARFTEGK